jgi:CopG family nickel-responsive transcriptional regulator
MERITVSIPPTLAAEFDRLIEARGYGNRSEAFRDLLRRELEAQRLADDRNGHCIATLSYVYNHHERDLAERLTHLAHEAHDLSVSTMHAHLDHDHCIEAVILRGPAAEVRAFANQVTAERGVRHGSLNLVTVERREGGHRHTHLHPRT